MNPSAEQTENMNKWRLILGRNAERKISFHGDYDDVEEMDRMEEALDYLYDREYEDELIRKRDRKGGSGSSQLHIADWLSEVRRLFPKRTVEILEKHALEHFKMTELVTDKTVLSKIEPNTDLLKTILEFKHMMKDDVLSEARRIIKKVVDDLTDKLKTELRKSLLGKLDRSMPSSVRTLRNLDIRKTIRANLRNYDTQKKQIMLKDIYFSSRTNKYSKKRIIIAVDESGSMLDSVIYSAVMAGIFAKLPMLDTKLVIFDTQVVDLSGYADDPVEVLMGMQLGGGTDIGKAITYCEGLCSEPYSTIYVVVTDLCEGGSIHTLLQKCNDILNSGSKMFFLTALDRDANPVYDKDIGQKLADMGAFIGAMTPEMLGDHIGRLI